MGDDAPVQQPGIMTYANDVKAVAQAIQAVIDLLKQFDEPKSCVLEIDNHTHQTLIKIDEDHSSGGWGVTPTGQIDPNQVLVFGSQGKHFGPVPSEGSIGYITYQGDGFEITASWDNPIGGNDHCDFKITGPNAGKYRINHECGVGDKDAHMRYELYSLEVEFESPKMKDTISGIVDLKAKAGSAMRVEFSAYYADQPKAIYSVHWHPLGPGKELTPGEFTYTLDTTTIPDQANWGWGTVGLQASLVDASGNIIDSDGYPVRVKNGYECGWVSPQDLSTVNGTTQLIVKSDAPAVQFWAWYADNPKQHPNYKWVKIGDGTMNAAGQFSLDWDTTTVPDQGEFTIIGTVRVEARPMDAHGNVNSNNTDAILVRVQNH